MADVFLSYAREDLEMANRLATLLEANGLSVWWDRRLIAGEEISTALDRAIAQAKAVVVLWSPNSVVSRWVNGEAETAAEAAKLIPVRISDCKIPIGFRGLHTPDVYKSKQELAELADLLSSKLRGDAPVEQKVKLSDASTSRFLEDAKNILLNPSPSFGDQLRREWEFGARYPIKYWGGGLIAYGLCIWLLSVLMDVSFQVANMIGVVAGLVLYLLYRNYRLSRSR
jgi:TIR domain-containing protein